jgi:hypothetical protein
VNTENGCDVDKISDRRGLSSANSGSDTAKTGTTINPVNDIGHVITACRRLRYLKLMTQQSSNEINNVFICDSYAFLHVWCWDWILSGHFTVSSDSNDPVHWQQATSKLSVYTGYILPMMFALLGTLIGAFRAILNKIGNSSLAPRDMVGMLVGIPVGLVAGFAVGLFFSPSAIPMQGAGGVSSTFSLAASGLGFLAGYASQSFFNYLDNLVGTMFPSSTSSTVRSTAVAVAAHEALTSTTPTTTPTPITTPTPTPHIPGEDR